MRCENVAKNGIKDKSQFGGSIKASGGAITATQKTGGGGKV